MQFVVTYYYDCFSAYDLYLYLSEPRLLLKIYWLQNHLKLSNVATDI